MTDEYVFEGFEPANTTPVPDYLFDELLPVLKEGELKCMLYIIRRTLGFKKIADTISLTQFEKGITTRDGKVLDHGCGLGSRPTIIRSLNSLVKRGFVEKESGKDPAGDAMTSLYRIHFRSKTIQGVVPIQNHPTSVGSSNSEPPLVLEKNHRSSQNTLQVVLEKNPQETVIQQTELQETVIQEKDTASANGYNPEQVADATPPSLSLISDSVVTTGKTENDYHFHIADTKAEPTKPDEKEATSRQHDTLKVRVEKMYKVFDSLFRELMNDPSYKEPRTDKSTKAIKALIQAEATDERIRFVLMDIWNDKDDFWKKHRTITSVASQYSTRVSKMQSKTPSGALTNGQKPRAAVLLPEHIANERKRKLLESTAAQRAEMDARQAARLAQTGGK